MHFGAEDRALAQAVANKFLRVVAAVQILGEIGNEGIEGHPLLVFLRDERVLAAAVAAEERGSCAEKVHRVNAQALVLIRLSQRSSHREGLEGLDDLLRI